MQFAVRINWVVSMYFLTWTLLYKVNRISIILMYIIEAMLELVLMLQANHDEGFYLPHSHPITKIEKSLTNYVN